MPYSLNGVYPDKFQILSEDGERVLCRAWRLGDDGARRAVLVVLSGAERPTRSSLDRLTHEHGLKDELDSARAVRPLELLRDGDRAAASLGRRAIYLGLAATVRSPERTTGGGVRGGRRAGGPSTNHHVGPTASRR
jgi:hypothetical protein